MDQPRSVLEHDLFDLRRVLDYGMTAVAGLIAAAAFALSIWTLDGGLAALGSTGESPAGSATTVTGLEIPGAE